MLDLLDYRRRVFELYRQLRAANGDPAAWDMWRRERDTLFKTHPQSALDEATRPDFGGLRYYAYDPAYRLVAAVDYAVEEKIYAGEMGADGHLAYRRFAQVRFEVPSGAGILSLYWIMGYGGGLFLPFGDTTNGSSTYSAGRYLYDSIKGADLGATPHQIVLDFNYACHPSCVYDPRWVCPLAPAENKLAFAIPAGERL
jgi:uncharacterized protein (DUF1684 family)